MAPRRRNQPRPISSTTQVNSDNDHHKHKLQLPPQEPECCKFGVFQTYHNPTNEARNHARPMRIPLLYNTTTTPWSRCLHQHLIRSRTARTSSRCIYRRVRCRCNKERKDYKYFFTQSRQEVHQYRNRLLRRVSLGAVQVLFRW